MTATPARRFHKDVAVREREGDYALLLDGRLAKTPHGAALVLPSHALAQAVASEWRAHGERLDVRGMGLTHLVYCAIDRVGRERGKVIDHTLAFGRSDLLCYRAESPPALAVRQAKMWDPLLAWAHDTFGLRLIADAGIAWIEQPADALVRIEELAAGLDDFRLAAFDAVANATGSFVLALALVKGHVGAERAFEAALLDELYQSETWGGDAEAEDRRHRLREELEAVERYLSLFRQS